jgi:hypothetical protein
MISFENIINKFIFYYILVDANLILTSCKLFLLKSEQRIKQLRDEREVKKEEKLELNSRLFKIDAKNKNQASELQKLRDNVTDIARLKNENEILKKSCC